MSEGGLHCRVTDRLVTSFTVTEGLPGKPDMIIVIVGILHNSLGDELTLGNVGFSRSEGLFNDEGFAAANGIFSDDPEVV